MKKQYLKTVILAAALAGPLNAMGQVATPTHTIQQTFTIPSPDYKLSPYTGMTRQSWIDAAEYLLSGAFTYIRTLDDPMYFPKQLDKAYPNNEGQVPTAKLEGFCRTLFVAAPLLREKPELTLNGIKVADYYRHQLLNLIRPDSPSFIPHRKGGPSQILVEFGALAISLSVAKDILWEPLTQEQKDQLAATMLSYGNGPTIGSNWMFFNVFVISFFKEQGYAVNDQRMKENLEKILKLYRGEGWYNDAPAYDYYSMWAFQMYGPIWAQMYGHFYPEYAAQFMKNQHDLADNYPYMFSAEGKMNMWGRSIPYRFGAVVPLALLGYEKAPDINYGWMRRIASATLLQFLQNPDFLEDNVPTLGFYGTFAPAVQIYSCRGSVYWCGKAFLSLLLPADNPFWTAVENNGPWEKEFKKDHVYNKFQPATNLLITDYPNCGGAEMRSWCHETVANDWQKFRSSENYNKLDFSGIGEGEQTVELKSRNFSNDLEVLIVPQTVTVTVSQKVTKTFSLGYRFKNEDSLKDKHSVSVDSIEHSEVEVRGSQDNIDNVYSVEAVIDLKGVTDSFTQECKVKAFDRSGKALNVSVIPSTVKVDCSLSNYSKTVPLVPEYTGNVANGYAIDQMTFSKDKVKIYGDESKLKDINNIKVKVDVSDLEEGRTFKDLKLLSVSGVNKMSFTKVDGTITLVPSEQRQFTDIPIQIKNGKENNVSMSSGTCNLTVIGTSDRINALTNDDIKVYVDVVGLKKGRHNVKLEVELSDETLTYRLDSDEQIRVNIKK